MKFTYIFIALSLFLFSCSNGSNTAKNEEPTDGSENVEQPLEEEEVEEQAVFFTNLEEGVDVKNPISIQMGVKGMIVEPKGAIKPNSGHHHLIIDDAFVEAGQLVPTDETHIHFGGGQEEGEITLTPGKHTLTLQFADGMHMSYGENMSSTITVNVVE